MIAHLNGRITHKSPAYIVVECHGVGYGIQISLNTYSLLPDEGVIKIHTHLSIKEDAHVLYGFAEESERQLFLLLISVNGVGPNTARMILSSMKPAEVSATISEGNWNQLKSVKGIGPKTAQRIVVDLQDKIRNVGLPSEPMRFGTAHNPVAEEALLALQTLGFSKADADKAIQKIQAREASLTVAELIKQSLKIL